MVVEAEAPKLGMLKGFYNKNCSTQGVSVDKCRPLLAQAAELVPFPPKNSQALHIGEWGCASGGNSIAPVLTVSEILNQRVFSSGSSDKLQLHVTHSDVAGNSWTELFQCAKQYQALVHRDFPHLSVTYAGIGSSQYERNHPDASLDLGFSCNALHWLSKWPCLLKHTLSPFSSKALPEELSALDAQAAEDLLSFLTLRAAEFKAGGVLVLNFGTLDHDDTRFLELMDINQAVADEMVAEGLLAEQELGHLAPPVHFLNEAAHRKVFSQVGDKWELLHYDRAVAINPQVEELLQEGAGGTAAACGQIVADFLKAAMCPFLEAGLKKAQGRDQATVDSLVDTYYSRVAARVAANPVSATYPTVRVLLRRRA